MVTLFRTFSPIFVIFGLAMNVPAFAQNAELENKRTLCLAILKERLKRLDFALVTGSQIELQKQVSSFNSLPPLNFLLNRANKTFSWEQPKRSKSITAMSVSAEVDVTELNRTKIMDFTINQSDTADQLFELVISGDVTDNRRFLLEIDQTFQIDLNCKENLDESSVRVTVRDNNSFTISEQDFGTDNAPPSELSTKTINIPAGKHFVISPPTLNSLSALQQVLTKPGASTSILMQLKFPYLKVSIRHATESRPHPVTNVPLVMKGVKGQLQGAETTIDTTILFSANPSIGVRELDSHDKWFLPIEIWEKGQIISKSHDATEQVRTNLYPPGREPSRLQIISNSAIDFDNMQMYWRPTNYSAVESKHYYILNAQPEADYTVSQSPHSAQIRPTSMFLAESKYVQFNIPEIQSFATEVKSTLPPFANAAATAVAISRVIARQFHYDYSRLNIDSNFEDMPTRKIVQYRSGTCQNLSNVFAAIARALGLPSRIIVGINISRSGIGYHTWNEFMDADGTWRPFEPQDFLGKFNPATYLPLVVEENDTYDDAKVQAAMGNEMTIKFPETRPTRK